MMDSQEFMFKEHVRMFMLHLERQGYSYETTKGYSGDLEQFRLFMESQCWKSDFPIDYITKRLIVEFMDEGRGKGHKANTVGRRLAALKSFLKFLLYECDYSNDAASRIRIPKVYTPLKTIPSEAEVQNLLEVSKSLGSYYHLLFSLIYYTGSRITPVRLLERQHVHIEERMVYFEKVKGGRDLYLPMHESLVTLFTNYLLYELSPKSTYVFPSPRYYRDPVSPTHIRQYLKKALVLAGMDMTITPHTLRHCTATHLTIRNVSQYKIASILGHSDLRSTMRYQHLAVNHLRDQLNLLGNEDTEL